MKKYWELFKNYNFGVLAKAGVLEIYRIIWRQMVKGSYSQNYEDLIIDKIFNKQNGTYLEIGAYHPTRLSNTYRLYKKGWIGTVIEPNPEVEKLFKTIRPKDNFLNIGVADKSGEMNYYQFLIPALNTFSKKEADNGHKLIRVCKIKIKSVTEVVDKNFDFLSLDTEGFDELILKNWPWNKCKPKVICVENNVENILTKNGYRIFTKTKDNTIFVFA